MEDIKKLVADWVTKKSDVFKENETIIKGLVEVSSMLDNYAKETDSQRTRSVSTSSNYQKTIDINEPQKTLEQAKKKPRILLQKTVESLEETLQRANKEVLAFKKLVDGRASKKCTEALTPSIVKPIPKDTNMGYTIPMDFDSNILWLGLT
ncbi:hypothetical protein DSO57_1011793 [Entomophthora muscae]|uniref:Uncharacterized protein n=1 Tax=Entomophthora muscae TaxID=34485 RepID=A0ACC2TGY7_9FUNG|nr:hypothetical protein DSO57_1011793 [Entomophthora muscae]